MKILRARRTAWLFIVCAAVVPASTGAGAVTGGARDWSYGLGGYARADVRGSDVALRSALQPDGKLVVAGFSGGNPSPGAGIGLARFTKAGILDPTFGSGGRVFIPLHDSFPVGLGVTLKGRIVVGAVGWSTGPLAPSPDIYLLARKADGSRDRTFGGDGEVRTGLTVPGREGLTSDGPEAMTVLPDGRIILAGWTTPEPVVWPLTEAMVGSRFVERFLATGAPDPSFGVQGRVPLPGVLLAFRDIATLTDGSILLAGSSTTADATGFRSAATLVKLTATGGIDTAFGTAGVVRATGPYSEQMLESITVQRDGKIVGTGYSFDGAVHRTLFARFTKSGAVDAGFGVGGREAVAYATYYSIGRAVHVDDRGRILVAETTFACEKCIPTAAVARLMPSGARDTSFGDRGIAVTGATFFGVGLELQAGKALLVATLYGGDFAAVRLLL